MLSALQPKSKHQLENIRRALQSLAINTVKTKRPTACFQKIGAAVAEEVVLKPTKQLVRCSCISPTSVSNLNISEFQQQNRHRKKHVRFHESCKTWDGLRPENARFQRVISEFFGTVPSVACLRELFIENRVKHLFTLRKMLRSLILRIKHGGPTGSTMLLPTGSRKYTRLNASHLPRVEKVLKITSDVYDSCKAVSLHNVVK